MEDCDPFLPFAKRSKEVHRYSEETVVPEHHQNDQTLWDRVLRLPCEESFRCESSHDFPPNTYSSAGDWMVTRHKGGREGLTHEKLPCPSELLGRKRSQRIQRRAAHVLQHIGDLKKRQRHIDETKGEKWWGSIAVSEVEESRFPEVLKEAGNKQLLGPSADVRFSAFSMDNPDLTQTNSYKATSLFRDEFLYMGCKQLLDLAPGGNPMMSFVVKGTAHRSLQVADNAFASPTMNSEGSDGIPKNNDDEMSHF